MSMILARAPLRQLAARRFTVQARAVHDHGEYKVRLLLVVRGS